MPLDKEFLHILACPQCKGDLTATDKEDGLVCAQCKIVFPVKEGIPILMLDEADPWTPAPAKE